MACTVSSNWAQVISRTRLRVLLRSCPRNPRGSSVWGESVRSGSGRRRVDREGMDGEKPSPATLPGARSTGQLLPGRGAASAPEPAHEILLCDAHHQPAGAVEELPAGQATPALRGRAVHRVEQPVVDA